MYFQLTRINDITGTLSLHKKNTQKNTKEITCTIS